MAGSKSTASTGAHGSKAAAPRGRRGAPVRVAGVWDDGSAVRSARGRRPAPGRGAATGTGPRRTTGPVRADNRRPDSVGTQPGRDGGEQTGPAAWLRWTTFGLALLGLAVSAYLTYAHFTQSSLAGCTETSGLVNCGKVTTSPESMVFGVFPVAVLGLVFYAFLAVIMSPAAWRSPRREVAVVRLLSMIVGMGFVLYLVYAELFQIGSICVYCTSVHAITFLLFVLTLFAAAVWGLAPRTRPDR